MKIKRTKTVIFTLIAALAVGYGVYQKYFTKTPIYYLTDTVKTQDLEVTILADGKLEASEQVEVGAQVSGQIKKRHVKLGDVVTKGQLLAEIDDLPRQNAVKDSEARLKNVQAAKVAKQAQIVNARINLQRQQNLIKQKATAQSEVDMAEANLQVLEAELESLDAQIAQAKIALDSAQLDLDYTKIISPIDGVVVATVVKEGQTVNASQTAPTIVKVADLDTMNIKAQISEADITKITPGMKAYFTILGEPKNHYPATLESTEPAPEKFQTATGNTATTASNEAIYYAGILTVDNHERRFRIDMTAQVYIVVDGVTNQPTISTMATRFKPSNLPMPEGRLQPNEAYVWVKNSDGTIAPKKVTLGISNNIHTEVIDGLTGDEVIVLSETSSDAKNGPNRMPRMR
ncbi:efflux RND transporter periplasmic adaptor subunit [Wohlfahrtiimonas chitiniclastica]|uniref:efflux RND transporter periplasmic adaptor subunit n=1 Tax=Wohlfahrtiimonas chitiniclastica TaxID=400946 RepID=UPI001BD11BF3|nr:efflux RND transporter periplasmic adaptor subunit [Wohlfahrtiimonas chitiniclastica]MBS7821523.1 efflux RND transporter periplasmic adaptor subunit [Wohlfahrtiimonas chitiniclastica]